MEIFKTYASKEFQKNLEQMRSIWEFDGFDDFFDKYGVEITLMITPSGIRL